MNNIVLAKSNLRQAWVRLKHAEEELESGDYPYIVRQCQEAVELSLKAALRLVGVEPPKWHDPGPVLRRERNRFPEWFREHIDEFASISRSLRKERELAMNSDEETDIPAEELYTRYDAEQALNMAKKVLEHVEKLLQEIVAKH